MRLRDFIAVARFLPLLKARLLRRLWPSWIVFLDTDFLPMLLNVRVLWLAGRYGGGKTALASILAAWLWWRGYVKNVVANYPLKFADPNPRPPLTESAIVLDEAWQFARDSQAVFRYAGFMRKLGNFLLLPSVFPPHPRLSFFWTERVFNAYIVAIPAWIFRWNLQRLSHRERGYFAVLNPHAIFEMYDSWSIDTSDGAIADLLSNTVRSLERKTTPTRTSPKEDSRAISEQAPIQLPLPETKSSIADELNDAVQSFSEVAESLTERLQRFARRLR